jgi:hypothetical protein
MDIQRDPEATFRAAGAHEERFPPEQADRGGTEALARELSYPSGDGRLPR